MRQLVSPRLAQRREAVDRLRSTVVTIRSEEFAELCSECETIIGDDRISAAALMRVNRVLQIAYKAGLT